MLLIWSTLTGGTQYDVQVRAVSGIGAGPWSATVTGTPTTWGARRSFSPERVAAGGEVEVTIALAGLGGLGFVVETPPAGFSNVSSGLSHSAVSGRRPRSHVHPAGIGQHLHVHGYRGQCGRAALFFRCCQQRGPSDPTGWRRFHRHGGRRARSLCQYSQKHGIPGEAQLTGPGDGRLQRAGLRLYPRRYRHKCRQRRQRQLLRQQRRCRLYF